MFAEWFIKDTRPRVRHASRVVKLLRSDWSKDPPMGRQSQTSAPPRSNNSHPPIPLLSLSLSTIERAVHATALTAPRLLLPLSSRRHRCPTVSSSLCQAAAVAAISLVSLLPAAATSCVGSSCLSPAARCLPPISLFRPPRGLAISLLSLPRRRRLPLRLEAPPRTAFSLPSLSSFRLVGSPPPAVSLVISTTGSCCYGRRRLCHGRRPPASPFFC